MGLTSQGLTSCMLSFPPEQHLAELEVANGGQTTYTRVWRMTDCSKNRKIASKLRMNGAGFDLCANYSTVQFGYRYEKLLQDLWHREVWSFMAWYTEVSGKSGRTIKMLSDTILYRKFLPAFSNQWVRINRAFKHDFKISQHRRTVA